MQQRATGNKPLAPPQKVVIYTQEVLGERMAGPGIRALRFAEALAPHAEVRLIAQATADLSSEDFFVGAANGPALLDHVRWADVLVIQSPIFAQEPEIFDIDVIIVCDLYDPFLLEELQQGLYVQSTGQEAAAAWTVGAVNDMLRYSDYFICASEKQRDMWIGQLMSVGRLNPLTYRDDPSLRRLIDLAPFGVDAEPPVRTAGGVRGVVEGIGENDKIVLWGGGIYDWFDPLILIRAVAELSKRHADIRLFFLAKQHANPVHGVMKMAVDAQKLADELDVLGSVVFFNEQWVRHADRANYFLDADLGVSTHLDHLETRFSFRTRLLDYLWAGLPIVNSAGDAFESVIVERGLGAVVLPGDQLQLEQAIEKFLYDDAAVAAARSNVRDFAPSLGWQSASKALVSFCLDPYHAADARHNRAARVTALAAHSAVEQARDDEVRRGSLTEAELRERIRSLEASTSWRLTAPLRAITGRRGRG
ncbi:glycosyltransferase family 1 protein [Subtercola sp. PAMC28395]|uniref:glycosyltransferase family 1 protein n=1 Tax=Subtercola sp. PAMC28395 TaxID=2846775 RepID=UPI001C0E650F|nr:glycosyltransferase family 1 protein [Subtercola sp. PAMC28395]QWT23730.1 glycosyltransferase family 1 protein [Subtercola sp. PAMC28395]